MAANEAVSPALPEAAHIPAGRGWHPANIVLAMAAALLVAVFGTLAWLTWTAYGSSLAQAEQRARIGAATVADQAAWLLSSASLALRQVADAAATTAEPTPNAVLAVMDQVQQRVREMRLAAYDASGKSIGGQSLQAESDISRSDFFLLLRSGADLLVAPQDSGNGQPSFLVAQRLVRAGQFDGAVVARVDQDLLARVWTRIGLGPESTISLVRDDGLVVGRYPSLAGALNLGSLPVFQTLQSTQSGTYQSQRSPADGVARVVAFDHVPGFGAIAIASVSQDAVINALWTAVRTVLYLLAPIGLALGLAALVVASLLRRSARTQGELRNALEHNDLLFREIHHRVKNNLQSVNALIQMQSIPKNVKIDMGQRIAAMSAVHEHIYRSSNFNTIAAKPYLDTLLDSLRSSYDPEISVIGKLDDFPIDKDTATPLGLIVNEVVSNAYKHAFTDGRKGTIVIEFTRDGENRARLVVTDDGVGLRAGEPSKGLGRKLIAALTEQIGGTLAYASDGGTRFEMTFPLPASG